MVTKSRDDIKKALKRIGLSQKELAIKAGFSSYSKLASIINGFYAMSDKDEKRIWKIIEKEKELKNKNGFKSEI